MKRHILFILILHLAVVLPAQNQSRLDSLYAAWNDDSLSDSLRLQAIHRYAWDGYLRSLPDSAFYFAQIEYDMAKASDNKFMMARALNTQGMSWRGRGDYDQALDYLQKSLALRKEVGDQLGLAGTYNNMGLIHMRKGEFVKALEYYQESLKIKEQEGDKELIASSLTNIGSVFAAQGDFEQALNYYNKSQKFSEEIGDKEGLATVLIHKGTIYADQGDFAPALDFFEQSLSVYKEMGNLWGITGLQHNMGMIASAQGDHDKAYDFYSQSLQMRQKMGDKGGIAESNMILGMHFQSLGNFPTAISHSRKALNLAQEIGDVEYAKDASWDLYICHKELRNYSKALEMHELSISLRDSILSEKNQRAAIQQQYRYEYEKQKALDDLENEKQIASEIQKKKNQQKLTVAIGLGLLFISCLTLVIFNRLKVTRQQKTIIETQKKEVEQSEKYKEQFLANMSHEIRTPMHAISGMVKILKRKKHLREQEVFLNAMRQSSDNLLVLLNDILDFSKVEAGKLDVEFLPMEPAEVINNVKQILQFKAEEKGLELHTAIFDDLPTFLMGDPNRIGQILTNLAGNAIKFTEKGSVWISASRKNDFMTYEVRDTGIGIPEDRIQSIFEAFEQGEASTSRQFGGTGLGLNISRQLVELMGGNIWVESEVGKGSTFFVSLPWVAVNEDVAIKNQRLTEDQLMAMGAKLRGKHILLAEDNEFNQMIAQDDLAYYIPEVQVDRATNGALALEMAIPGQYDLILMDVQMPEMDGIEASLKIREWEKANGKSPIPIIAMTASLLKSEVNLCLEAGMDNYIPKPYEVEELVGRIYEEMIDSKHP